MTDRLKIVDLVGGARTALGIAPSNTVKRSRSTASVLLFRPVRSRRHIEHMARVMRDAPSAEHAELYLKRDIEMIEQDLIVAGAAPSLAIIEAHAIRNAIQAEVWKLILTPDRSE